MSRCKLDLVMITWTLISVEFARGQLIRPLYVYENLIKGIHDYYNNTCIILLHARVNSMGTVGLEDGYGLLTLQKYLSTSLHIRTAIMDFDTFSDRVGMSYYHIKRPLFVLLNDHEDVRNQFARQVSTWIAMAYPTWLLFVDDGNKIEDFFLEIYVPFDCIMLFTRRNGSAEVIREIYQVDRGKKLRYMDFGSWDEKNGLILPRLGLYQRRNNLYGHNLRVVSIEDPPVSLIIRDEQGETVGLGGFFGDVVKLLQESINCTFSYMESDSWGVPLSNGTWTGTIGMLVNNEADLAAAELMMTSDRMDAADFTTPVYSSKCRAFIKRPESTVVKWKAYMAPFAESIWHSIGLLIVVCSCTIRIIKAAMRTLLSWLKDYESAPTRFAEIFFDVFGAFCNQGMEQSLLDPVRVMHLVIHLTAVVILAAYSAALISFLAVKTFMMPFTTMEGFLEDGTYRFGVVYESADYSFFQGRIDELLSAMFKLITQEKELPRNYLEGLKQVCSEDKYAFMITDYMEEVLRHEVDCILEPLDAVTQTTIAMAVRNRSPYRGLLNSNILLLRDSGILQRLLNLHSNRFTRAKTTWTSVEINDVLPLIIFMIVALFLSCILLPLENFIYKRLKQLRLRRKKVKKVKF